jgi:electron transfer flavoprotein-quinone oxidoreductase
MKDLKKYKDMPALLHTNSANFFMAYPQLISQAAQNFLRVDGTPKIDMEKKTSRAFIEKRSRLGLISDAVKLAFAWR